MADRPTAVDLFSGAGGLSLGFEQAGFDVVASIEHDPVHAAAHRFNFPRCAVLQQPAETVTPAELRRAVSQGLEAYGRRPTTPVDVVIGGPPCQGFSVGGRAEPNDPRNALVGEFVRIVKILKPHAFLLENVPAMGSAEEVSSGANLPSWIADELGAAGYDVAPPTVLNASRYGVPQDRRRLIIVGSRAPLDIPSLPTPNVSPRPKRSAASPRRGEWGHPDTPTSMVPGPTVWDAIGDLPEINLIGDLLDSDSTQLDVELQRDSAEIRSNYSRRLAGETTDDLDYGYRRQWDPSVLTSSMRTVHASTVRARFENTREGETEPVSRFYRLDRDGLSATLRAGSTPDRGSYSAPRPIHPEEPRVISVREAARLHGFPDWFRFTAAKWHGFRQVGNAVPPPLGHALGAAVMECLRRSPTPPTEILPLGDPELLKVSFGAGRRRRQLATA